MRNVLSYHLFRLQTGLCGGGVGEARIGKTCPTGFAWSCQVSGATGNGCEQWLGAEFLYASTEGLMAHATALAHLRRCLVKYTFLAVEEARRFTVHSLKTTPLTWGLQIQVGVEEGAVSSCCATRPFGSHESRFCLWQGLPAEWCVGRSL